MSYAACEPAPERQPDARECWACSRSGSPGQAASEGLYRTNDFV